MHHSRHAPVAANLVRTVQVVLDLAEESSQRGAQLAQLVSRFDQAGVKGLHGRPVPSEKELERMQAILVERTGVPIPEMGLIGVLDGIMSEGSDEGRDP
jgi:hypothetical protein